LKTGDKKGDIEIVEGLIDVVWAYNPTTKGPAFVQHDANTKLAIKIDFFTGKTVTAIDLRVVHGIMMFLAWAVLVPCMGFLARYFKNLKWWFNVHRIVNLIAMLAATAAFGVAIQMTKSGHFNDPHKIIGLVVTIIGTAQPIIGFIADKMFNPQRKSIPIFPDKTHWVLGWGSCLLGVVNVLLGLILFDASLELKVAYSVYAAILVIFLIVFGIYKYFSGATDPKSLH